MCSSKTLILLTHAFVHVNIWFRFVRLMWPKGLVWEPRTVGKTNQRRWWFTGRGLFPSRKNKTWKQNNHIWNERFPHGTQTPCWDLAGTPLGRSEALHLAPLPAWSNSVRKPGYFARKKKSREDLSCKSHSQRWLAGHMTGDSCFGLEPQEKWQQTASAQLSRLSKNRPALSTGVLADISVTLSLEKLDAVSVGNLPSLLRLSAFPLQLSSFLPFSWLPRCSPSCHDRSFCFRAQVGSPLFLHSDEKGKLFPSMLIIRDLVPVFPFKNTLPKVQLFFIRHSSPPHNALLHFNTDLWSTSWSFQIPPWIQLALFKTRLCFRFGKPVSISYGKGV